MSVGIALNALNRGPWQPNSIPGLVWWLRADKGITVNGSNEVTSWLDQSGQGDGNRNLGNGASTDKPSWNAADPDYNNQPTVGTFNKAGSADDCRLTTLGAFSTTYSEYTMLVVGHAGTGSNRYFGRGSGTDYETLANSSNVGTFYVSNTVGSSGTLQSGPGFCAPRTYAMGYKAPTTTALSMLFSNGLTNPRATTTMNTSSLGAQRTVGCYPGSATSFGVEKVAEVIVYNRALTLGERLQLQAYLDDRYGMNVPPSTYNLTGWWRAPYVKHGWPGNRSVGPSNNNIRSLIQTQSFNQPATTSSLNSLTVADFDGANHWLNFADTLSVHPLSTYFSASAGSVACLFNADTAFTDTGVTTPYNNPCFVCDRTNTLFAFGFSNSGVRFGFFDGSWNSVAMACPTGSWHLAQGRWDGTKIEVRVDNGAWVTASRGSITNLTSNIFVGWSFTASRFFDGKIAELMTSATTFTDAQFGDVWNYCASRYALSQTLDPTSLALTGLWRGSYTGAPWTGTNSSGPSGIRSQSAGTAPTVGAVLNVFTPAVFNGSTQNLFDSTNTAEAYLTTTAYRVSMLINIASASAPAGSIFNNVGLLTESGGNWGIVVSQTGVSCYHNDGSYKVATKAITTGSWHAVDVQCATGSLTIAVDGVPSAPVSVGTLGSITGGVFRLGTGFANGAATRFSGSIMEVDVANTALLNVSSADWRNYYNYWYGVNVYDPALLGITGWWRASYSGSPWTGVASAGASSGRNLTEATNPPGIGSGSVVNGYTPAEFDGVNDLLGNATAISSFISAGAWSLISLVYIDNVSTATATTMCSVIGDTQGFWGHGHRSSGGNKCYSFMWDGADKSIEVPITTGSWHLLQSKYDGATHSFRVDNGLWNTLGGVGNVSGLAGTLQVGKSYTGNHFGKQKILELVTANTAFSDATFDDIRSYIIARYGVKV